MNRLDRFKHIIALLLIILLVADSTGMQTLATENDVISQENETLTDIDTNTNTEPVSEPAYENVTEDNPEIETNNSTEETSEVINTEDNIAEATSEAEEISESLTEELQTTEPNTELTTEEEAKGYKINTELLKNNLDEISLEETGSQTSELWKKQLSAIEGLEEERDYFKGTFYFEATNREEAELVASIYNGKLSSYSSNIATVHIEDYSSEEVLKECDRLSEELSGIVNLPPIYVDSLVRIASEENEEDQVELEMAYGGYEDWFHEATGVYSAWNSVSGKGVRVAILDTGAATHRDIKYAGRYNAFADDATNMENARSRHVSYNNEVDNSGHGTAIAGIIAGKGGNNKESVIGMAPDAKLLSIKCMEKYGDEIYGDSATVIRAIYMAVELGAKIINVSFTDKAVDASLYEKAVNEAVNAGAIVVCAAGNEASDTALYPAACTNSLSISATKLEGGNQVFDDSYSSYGSTISFAAPGSNIRCADYGAKDAYSTKSGTSLAAAVASGTIALYMEANPELNKTLNRSASDKVIGALQKTAQDLGDAGRDDKYGYGAISASGMLGASAFNVTAKPKFSITGGPVQSDVGIKIYSSNGDSTIYYTLDGTDPTVNSLKYSAERDIKGLIYLPENVGDISLRAISIGPSGTTAISQANYTVVPAEINIEGSAYAYAGELGKSGFKHDYAIIRGVTTGSDMPYQIFNMDLNAGDSVSIALKASGFNGELYLQCDGALKLYDVRPVTASKVDAKYERTIKYTNASKSRQKLKITVSSGQLLQGQGLASGRGKYLLNVNVTRNISGLNLILPSNSLVKGRSMLARAVIVPTDAVNKKVTYRLFDKNGEDVAKAFATVDVTGKISIKTDVSAPVQYTVRATSQADPNLYSEKKFTVYPIVTSMESLEDTVELSANGSNNTFDASKNFAVTPGNSLGQYVYTSSNQKVASVDNNGLVKALAPGNATIVTKANDGSNKTCKLKVIVTSQVNGITLTPASKVEPVSTYYPISTDSVVRVDASVLPANASNKKLQFSILGKIPDGVTLVSNRILVDKNAKAGSTFTLMAAALDGSGKSNSIRFKIYNRPADIQIRESTNNKDIINDKVISLNTVKKKNVTLRATPVDEKGLAVGLLTNVNWESLNTSVATVTSTGLVTVVGKGRTRIRAVTADGSKVRASVIINVVSGVTSIGISTAGSLQSSSEAQYLVAGKKTALRAECLPADADNKNVIWQLDKAPEGVSLQQGVIFIPANVKSGSVMVTAKAADGFGAHKTRTFTIYPDSVRKIVISSTASSLNTVTNKNCMLTAVTSPRNTAVSSVIWLSSNENVATVSSSGYVTATGAGTVKITAVAKDGYGAKSSITLKVTQPMRSFRIVSNKGLTTNDNKLLLTTGSNVLRITDISPAKVSDTKVSWKLVENVSGVTINEKNGRITVAPDLANRITNLRVRATINSSGAYIDQALAVYPKTTGVYLSESDMNFKLATGQVRTLRPTVLPLHAYNSYAANPFSYTTSDPNVATVTDDGKVVAVGPGVARITIMATDGSKKRIRAKVKVS